MSGHNNGAVLEGRVTKRGTSNGNARGGSEDRRRRREYLVTTYRADIDAPRRDSMDYLIDLGPVPLGEGVPACRCYRCGKLLTVDTVTVDRIIPGCQGGTYRRNNIRPACGGCNSETGATTRAKRRRPTSTQRRVVSTERVTTETPRADERPGAEPPDQRR